ncbi:MAG: hypothetical protein AAF298_21830 [Cyanobacteria bacterium P01_A01_bin.40]
MVQALRPDTIGSVSGKVICADTLNKTEFWRGEYFRYSNTNLY